jgi:hypothetical protein
VKKKWVILVVVLVAGLLTVLLVVKNGGPAALKGVSGTYICEKTTGGDIVGESLILKEDKTFEIEYGGPKSGYWYRGTYELVGDTLNLVAGSFVLKGEIKGNTIVFENGGTWVKQ